MAMVPPKTDVLDDSGMCCTVAAIVPFHDP